MAAGGEPRPRATRLTLIALGNLYAGREHTYGVFFVVAFVWIGLAHGPWTSLAAAPLAIVAYLVPFFFLAFACGPARITPCYSRSASSSWT
jgi:hypothetical protein